MNVAKRLLEDGVRKEEEEEGFVYCSDVGKRESVIRRQWKRRNKRMRRRKRREVYIKVSEEKLI